MIVSPEKKIKLQEIINDLPNTLISGKPGTGKGTFMNILEYSRNDLSFLKIDGSIANTNYVINKVERFSSACPYPFGEKKIVYLNEASGLKPKTQAALKGIIDKHEKITSYFFICNGKIDDALKSRCNSDLNLDDPPTDQILKRCKMILEEENCVYDENKVNEIIEIHYPDIRKIIGTLESERKLMKIF